MCCSHISIFGLEIDDQCSMRFLVKLWTMVTFTLVFVIFYQILCDWREILTIACWEAKRSIQKMQKKRNRHVELPGKKVPVNVPLVSAFMLLHQVCGRKYYFSRRCFPDFDVHSLASFLYYLPLHHSSLFGCLFFFRQQNLLNVICKINQL